MSEYDIETRLFGKEDINFDSNGTGEQTQYTDLNSETHPVTKLNASHIPLTQSARATADGATNVDAAVQNLAGKIRDVAGQNGVGMTEDKIIPLLTESTRQTQISAPFRNLGGHTLTFQFPEEGDVQVATAPLEFQGFYNGVLVIDLNGCDIPDNGTFSPEGILRIKNCHCHVRIIGDGRSTSGYGKIIFTDNHYGIAIIQSPSCSVEHITFEASAIAQDFALYTESGNAFFASCTFTNCGHMFMKSIYRDYVDAHKTDAQAHASLFAGKADLVHSHSQAQVSGLTDALSSKAPLQHSHALADITNFSSGILDSANYAKSAGYASSAGYVASAIASGGTADYASGAGYAASAGYAGSAGGLTNAARTTIINSVTSAIEYNGPFAVSYRSTTVGSSAVVNINRGCVVVGNNRYYIPATSNFVVPYGCDLYLSGESAPGDINFNYWATNDPEDVPLPYSSFVTKIANIRGGKAEQVQFGEITTLPTWNDAGGGGGSGGVLPDYSKLAGYNGNPRLAPGTTYQTTAAGTLRISLRDVSSDWTDGCFYIYLDDNYIGLRQFKPNTPGDTWFLTLSSGATFNIPSVYNAGLFIKFDKPVLSNGQIVSSSWVSSSYY